MIYFFDECFDFVTTEQDAAQLFLTALKSGDELHPVFQRTQRIAEYFNFFQVDVVSIFEELIQSLFCHTATWSESGMIKFYVHEIAS